MLQNNKNWLYINVMLFLLGLFYQTYYFFKLQDFDIRVTGHEFGTRFIIFYFGSLLATFYYLFKQTSHLVEYTNNSRFKFKIGVLTSIIYFIGIIIWSPEFNFLINFPFMTYLAGFYWSIVMGLMIIGAPNFFTNIFNFKYFKYGGKYSFGIYLLHPMCIHYVKEFLQIKYKRSDFEIIICYVILSYFLGFLFFYMLENILMKSANGFIKLIIYGFNSLEYLNEKLIMDTKNSTNEEQEQILNNNNNDNVI